MVQPALVAAVSSLSGRPYPMLSIRRAALLVAAVVATLAAPLSARAQLKRAMPDSLTDREFWQFFTTMSEEGGSFVSENFVSNEQTYQHVIPTLQHTLTPNGVYLGVGPEQNFTYIANLKPRMAVIFDIRRQNAMAHLMYKALFELAPTRAEFLSLLFSRPLSLSPPRSAKPAELFAAIGSAHENDSAYGANRRTILDRLEHTHGFALTADDEQSITHVYVSFFEAGPDINYGYRMGGSRFGSMYATYGDIQSLTNAAGVNMAFLASEENYQAVRALHAKNLIVPVVGDFAGPKAIRSVGEYLRQRGGTVTAFYLSNVEQYLFRGAGDAGRFYENVKTLPVDTTSAFIRSVPAFGDPFIGGAMSILSGGLTGSSSSAYSVRVVDSGGVSIVWTTTTDSTGAAVTTRRVDSSGMRVSPLQVFRGLRARDDSAMRAQLDSLLGLRSRDSSSRAGSPFRRNLITPGGGIRVSVGGSLTSGIAPIRASLDAYAAGRLATYDQAIALTKIDGWK